MPLAGILLCEYELVFLERGARAHDDNHSCAEKSPGHVIVRIRGTL